MQEGQARRRSGFLAVALAVGTLVAMPAAGAVERCAAWPGEPSPLPKVSDPDEMLARWAGLRARELAATARSLEQGWPVRAHQLWRRVQCLDPKSDSAAAGLTRTPLVAVHSPELSTHDTGAVVSDAWSGLAGPLVVGRPRPTASRRSVARAPTRRPGTPPAPDTAAFDRAFAQLESRVKGAQFEAALESAEAGREAARALGPAADAKRAAQLEVLAATAALALGRSDEARTSFGRALDSDPKLTLDPMSTPPKVRRALDRVKQERGQ